MKRKFPNLFIIGAPKCGTTSLARWLSNHPQIYFYVGETKDLKEEPHYWSFDLNIYKHRMSSEDYFKIFDNIDKEKYKYAGEASTLYLFSNIAVKAIEENIESPMYIVCIRNPIDMAFSLWCDYIRYFAELETDDFLDAFMLSDLRMEGQFIKINKCIYSDSKIFAYKYVCSLGTQLERLLNIVPKERVHIIVLDDIKENPRHEWLKIMSFLGIDDDGRTHFPVYNERIVLKNKILFKLSVLLSRLVHSTYPLRRRIGFTGIGLWRLINSIMFKKTFKKEHKNLDITYRSVLSDIFNSEIKKLEELLGRKFDNWKNR